MSLLNLIKGKHDPKGGGEGVRPWWQDADGNEIPLTPQESELVCRWCNTQGVYDPETMGFVQQCAHRRFSEKGHFVRWHVCAAHESGFLPPKAIHRLPETPEERRVFSEIRNTYRRTDPELYNVILVSPIHRLYHHGKNDSPWRHPWLAGSPLLTKEQIARYPDLDALWYALAFFGPGSS